MERKKTCCLTLGRVLPGVIFAWLLADAPLIQAAIIWNGPLLTYNQPSPNPTQASNQDRITPDVWLTRAASKGLFNAFSETNATALSPANTEWAFGSLSNYASLNYSNWLAWLNGQSPTTLVGQQAVLHLISDDIYISIKFTFWSAGGSGGFAYQRSTPAPPVLGTLNFSNGLFSFCYTANAGVSYVVQSSSDLVNWASLATNVASGSSMLFSDQLDADVVNFYRVVELPGP
jgi:hypothetical protein